MRGWTFYVRAKAYEKEGGLEGGWRAVARERGGSGFMLRAFLKIFGYVGALGSHLALKI